MEIKIKLTIAESEVELTLDEARELWGKLDTLFKNETFPLQLPRSPLEYDKVTC